MPLFACQTSQNSGHSRILFRVHGFLCVHLTVDFTGNQCKYIKLDIICAFYVEPVRSFEKKAFLRYFNAVIFLLAT